MTLHEAVADPEKHVSVGSWWIGRPGEGIAGVDYEKPLVALNKALGCYFIRGGSFGGGYLRFPW